MHHNFRGWTKFKTGVEYIIEPLYSSLCILLSSTLNGQRKVYIFFPLSCERQAVSVREIQRWPTINYNDQLTTHHLPTCPPTHPASQLTSQPSDHKCKRTINRYGPVNRSTSRPVSQPTSRQRHEPASHVSHSSLVRSGEEHPLKA